MQHSSSLRFNLARSTLPYGRRKYLQRKPVPLEAGTYA